MKRLFLALGAILSLSMSFAQSVQDGKRFLYQQRTKSARETFEKVLAANPADVEANYWLGQTFLVADDVAAAKAHYAKAMTATQQNPLIMVGAGHVELLEKKNAEARAHFDAALAPTKNKKNKNYGDANLLAAIGRANADGGSDFGDADYGIARLKEAAELDATNPEPLVSMGIAHLKRGAEYGGQAKIAFDEALVRDPKHARAYVRIGKIFESQKNTPILLENYTKAVEVDPSYAPGYLTLYTYYQNRDVNKAKEYLDKYIATADKDRETDYFAADYMFRAGRYQESLDAAKAIDAGLDGASYPKLQRLYAYNYDRLGDSVAAKNAMEKYMQTELPEKLTGDDYAMSAKTYLRVPGNEAQADAAVEKAVAADTSMVNKVEYMKQMAAAYALAGNPAGQFKWLEKAYALKPDNSARNLFFMADAAIRSKNYDAAQRISELYISNYADQPQGYNFLKNSAIAQDADTSKGSAIAAIERQNQYYMTDTAKNKNRIIQNNGYKVYYYLVKAKDYNKALESANAILALDPANNYGLMAKKEAERLLAAPAPRQTAEKKPAPAKGSGGAPK
jgi:Tfp pilus assembly protein PilF